MLSKWNTSVKGKLLVREVTTLKCLPFVSRRSPVGGYVPLTKGEGTVARMSALNWKPIVYGGLASITAECGKVPLHPLPAPHLDGVGGGVDHVRHVMPIKS